MSAIVGERDKLLQATIPRNLTPREGKALILTVDPAAFHVTAAGAGSPALATFTAHLIGIPGAVLWSATGGAVLSGSAGNVRTLAFSDMPGATTTVTATITYDGQAYLATQTITKVTDGSDANVTTETVLDVLAGQIAEPHLLASLRDRIALVDDPATTPGSVAARMLAESEARATAIELEVGARTAAIQGEIDDRIAAVLAEAGARTTYVQLYTYSKAESNEALSIQATALAAYADARKGEAIIAAAADVRNYSYSKSTADAAEAAQSANLTASYTAYADTKKTEAISAAAADVRSYAYSQAGTDGAIASMANTLRSEFSSSGQATTAYVQNWAYSKAQIDSAEASQSSALTTGYQSYADTKKSEAITTAAADVRSYSYSKSDVDGGQAAQSSALTAGYQGYADARKSEAIAAAAADVRSYTYGAATIDGAFASQANSITAAYTYADTKKAEAISVASADVRSYAYSKATVDGAIASSTNTVSARLDNIGGSGVSVESKISAQANSIAGLGGQAVLAVNVNGKITGVKVAATASNAAATSEVDIIADVFKVSSSSGPSKTLFSVQQVNGTTEIALNGNVHADGALTTRTLADHAVTTLDKFANVSTSCTFLSYLPFTIELKVYQYTDPPEEFGGVVGGWIFEYYTDQGAGFGYWTTIYTHSTGTAGNRFVDTFALTANVNPTYPNYRIRKLSGYNLDVSVLKVVK